VTVTATTVTSIGMAGVITTTIVMTAGVTTIMTGMTAGVATIMTGMTAGEATTIAAGGTMMTTGVEGAGGTGAVTATKHD
jgi:hypothetical protein